MLSRTILSILAAAGLTVSVAACGTAAQPSTASAAASPARAAVSPAPATARSASAAASVTGPASSSSSSLRLLTEPAAGIGPIYQLIAGARSSVDLTMYELNDPTAEADLTADAARGVNVRVLLDQHLEKSRNTAAYTYLAARRVHVRWAPSGTTYHQKTLTVDNATSVIMTLNLVAEDYPNTRDFAVIDTNHADVAAIAATFDADFAGRPITPPDGTDLVWSPTNAQASVLSVIDNATHSLAVEDEEMDDPTVTAALAAAAHRGVNVTITMTADSDWDSAFAQLAQAGAAHPPLPRRQQLPVHPRQSPSRRRRPPQPAGPGRIPEFLRSQPGLQPGTWHPHPRQAPDNVPERHPRQRLLRRRALRPRRHVHAEPGHRIERPVHRHRDRLQRLPQREQRLRPLQPARPGSHRDRRRLLAHLPHQQLRLRPDLPQRPFPRRPHHRNRRRRHLHHHVSDADERVLLALAGRTRLRSRRPRSKRSTRSGSMGGCPAASQHDGLVRGSSGSPMPSAAYSRR